MKMSYTAEELAYIAEKRTAFCKNYRHMYKDPGEYFDTYEMQKINLEIKERRRAAAMGKTVAEMRNELARENRHKSLLIKRERLEKALARINAELENWE